jgi:hypothetical protein
MGGHQGTCPDVLATTFVKHMGNGGRGDDMLPSW